MLQIFLFVRETHDECIAPRLTKARRAASALWNEKFPPQKLVSINIYVSPALIYGGNIVALAHRTDTFSAEVGMPQKKKEIRPVRPTRFYPVISLSIETLKISPICHLDLVNFEFHRPLRVSCQQQKKRVGLKKKPADKTQLGSNLNVDLRNKKERRKEIRARVSPRGKL